jgi:inner membrane protein
MDNITHTLTGLMMARAGLARTTPRGGSLMMMLAANTPDLDAVSFFFGGPGGLTYLEYHRGYAHSLALAPVMAVIPLLLAHWIRGASISWKAWLACLLGVLSHLALDLTNVYGVRLLLPFSPRWLHLDITQIIDPWILLIFFIAMAAPALSGMVNSEIRGGGSGGGSNAPKRAWAWVALVVLLGYEGFRFTAHQRAIAIMSAYRYGGDSTPKIWAMPEGVSSLRWRGIVETPDSLLDVPVDLTGDFDPGAGRIAYPAPESPALDAARATAPFQEFVKFNQVPFWRVTQMDDLVRVDLIDLRFGTPWQPGFAVATALVTPDGHVRETHFGMSLPGRGR